MWLDMRVLGLPSDGFVNREPLIYERRVARKEEEGDAATFAKDHERAVQVRKSRSFQYEVSASGYVPERDVVWQSFSRST